MQEKRITKMHSLKLVFFIQLESHNFPRKKSICYRCADISQTHALISLFDDTLPWYKSALFISFTAKAYKYDSQLVIKLPSRFGSNLDFSLSFSLLHSLFLCFSVSLSFFFLSSTGEHINFWVFPFLFLSLFDRRKSSYFLPPPTPLFPPRKERKRKS